MVIVIAPKESPTDVTIEQLSQMLREYPGDPIISNTDRGATKTLSWKRKFSINYDFLTLQHCFNAEVKDAEMMFVDLEIKNNLVRNVLGLITIASFVFPLLAIVLGFVEIN